MPSISISILHLATAISKSGFIFFFYMIIRFLRGVASTGYSIHTIRRTKRRALMAWFWVVLLSNHLFVYVGIGVIYDFSSKVDRQVKGEGETRVRIWSIECAPLGSGER